nr:MAG TPA: hypothetical protein [Caudoviricetes sp.]
MCITTVIQRVIIVKSSTVKTPPNTGIQSV